LGAIRFATGQKPHCVLIRELDLLQIENDAVILSFDFEEPVQLGYLFGLDPTAQGKGHDILFLRPLDFKRHRFSLEATIPFTITTGDCAYAQSYCKAHANRKSLNMRNVADRGSHESS
jgi:hypothetical protein